jgi:tetratricopeptide (TPR) repeat protein
MAAVIAIGAVCLQAPVAWSKTGPHFEVGVEMLKQFEYEKAKESFEKALEWPGNTSKERALILVYIGIAQSNMGDFPEAEKSFRRAQTTDPDVEPPKLTSPKIRAIFEKVKAESRATPAPKAHRRASAPAPKPAPAPATRTPGVDGVDEDEMDEEEDDQPSTVNWPAWLTFGAAVVAGGVGAAMGGLNLSEKSKAENTKIPYNEAQDHADKASTYGVAANILLITAGAAAVTSGILFYLGYKKKKEQEGAQATVVPTGSGVMLQVELWR